jgi:hypothetical protein
MKSTRFTRRNLLRGGFAATAAFPLLEAGRAEGQTGSPTRFVVFATPNGTRNSLFWPTGSETSFTLPSITAPLEPHKSKLLFMKGITLNPSLQNGALGGNLGSEHARGTGGMLTARPLNAGTDFISFGSTTSGWGSGQSIDQYLVTKLAPQTTHKSLHVGVHVRDTQVRARISYRGSNDPVPPREEPADLFEALMNPSGSGSGGSGGGTGATDPALVQLWAERKSVFDLTNAETDRIKGIVSAADRAKIDAFQTSMRDVETRLVGMPSEGTGGTGGTGGMPVDCVLPTVGSDNLSVDDKYAEAGTLQMDLAAAALACDQTRILTFQWSYAESEHLFQFLNNIQGNHHAISHDFGSSGTNFEAYNAIQTWYAKQFAYFLAKLDSIDEGDGTLLDHTIVLWATEIGESTQHDLRLMPYVFAGGAGGKIQMGRYIDWGNSPKDNNQMLVSIAHAMGDESLMSFGDPSGATGPLPI